MLDETASLGNVCAVVSKPALPPVSVVIPAFNVASVIRETLESVRRQTFQDFETIIVDDGSTDDTAAIVRQFCETDARFKLVAQSNAGVSVARNQGILKARGEWIALLDGDDLWFPEKLECQMALSREDPRANFLFTNFYFWDGRRDLSLMYPDNQPLPDGDTTRRLVFDYTYLTSTVAVRRRTLLEVNLFDPEMLMAQDWDLWLRIAEHGIWARGVREPLVRYRRWPGSSTVANQLKSLDYNALAFEKRLRATQRADLLPLYRRSLAVVQINREMLRLRRSVESDPAALPPFIWRAWRLDPRLKWLRWYLCLVWPKFLGGNLTRRYVYRKIRSRWPDTNNNFVAETPLISIVIPTLNVATVFTETLESVRRQTFQNFEAIIVDGGSTDDTAAIARQFCKKDPRFSFVSQPGSDISTARNAAIQRAGGGWIAFLDADDVWLPQKLERQLQLLQEDPRANFLFANYYIWDGQSDLAVYYRANHSLPEGDVSRRLVSNNIFGTSSVVVRREMLSENCRFDSHLLNGCEDWDLWLRLAEHGLWARGTREPLVRYRRWQSNKSNQKLKTQLGDIQVLEKNLHATQRAELRPLFQRSLDFARAKLELAHVRPLVETRPAAVPAALWRAWRLYPRKLKWLMWLALAIWPKFLGGRATARIVHRKIIEKF